MHEVNSSVPPSGTWLMCDNETGLLTVAIHTGHVGWLFPSRRDGISGSSLAGIHARLRECARITVAGQWRNFTALPEHFAAEQGWRGATGDAGSSRSQGAKF